MGTITAAVALYNLWQSLPPIAQWFSSPATKPEAQDIPFITVERTREYDGSGTAISTSVGAMAESQARQACPSYDQMQQWTNEGYAQAVETMPGASPQAIGVAAHLYVTNMVKASGDPSLQVAQLLPSYGNTRIPGQIMADVNEFVADGTVCIYDFKTGIAGLPWLRADEFARRTMEYLRKLDQFPSRFIVIEMRPR